MALGLDPFIRSKLMAFRTRYRGLVFLRGFCCGLLALLGGVLFLSLVDYLVVMEDRTRYVLSGGMYFSAMLVTWLACIRPLLRDLNERELAAMMEREEPLLRSKLLSAVELSTEDRDHESKPFRRQAQESAAKELRGLEMGKVLPASLVQVWLIAAGAVIFFTTIMAAFESGRVLQMRALAPMANIDRVSRNKIMLMNPQGGNAAVPENDEIQILIQILGPKLKHQPFLIAKRENEKPQKALFNRDINSEERNQYKTTVAVESKNVTYQIHAGDAVSRRYTLTSRERPRVVQYEKTYTFPNYSGRKPDDVKEDHGNLSALSGTSVELKLNLNQPVETAVMHQVFESSTNKLNFKRGADSKQWVLAMALIENGAYKVHLTTAEKLSNKSPVEYSIEAQPDLVPTVEIMQPGPKLKVRPEDIVTITSELRDDIGLAHWEQRFKVNQAEWKTVRTNLFTQPLATNATVKLDWDLLRIDVKPGDVVLTKLAAVDRKGNRTESRSLRVNVDSALFDAERISSLEEQRQWVDLLKQAVAKTLVFDETLPKDLENLILPGKDAERRAKAEEAVARLEEAKVAWMRTAGIMQSVIRKARPGREATGLSLVGRMGVRLEADWFPHARLHLIPLKGIVLNPKVEAHIEALPSLLEKIHSANADLESAATSWLAADEAAVALDLLDYIQRAAASMHRVAKADKDIDIEVWNRLARRQASACKELEVAKDVLKQLAGHAPEKHRDLVSALHDELDDIHKTLTAKHAEGVKPDSTLLAAGLLWSQAISDARGILRPVARELGGEVALSLEKLEDSVGSNAGAVKRLLRVLEVSEQAKGKLEKARKDGENVLSAQARVNVSEELLDLEWSVAQEVLRGRARMEESGRAGSALFVSDTAQAAAALGAVREGMESGRDLGKVKAQLRGVAGALVALEVAHELTLLEGAAKSLAKRERWEHKATDANSLRPRDWKWLALRLSGSPRKLRAAGLAGDGKLDDLVKGTAAKAVEREMEQRQVEAGFFVEPNESKSSD